MYDIIIVGSGVAGSYLATVLKSEYNILLIERNEKIVPKDSGIVSKTFYSIFGRHAEHLIKHKITKMDLVSPSGIVYPLKSSEPFAYILKRKKFSRFLRKNASKSTETLYANVVGVEQIDGCVKVKTTNGDYTAKMVIGCDGANSVVRNFIGISPPKLALGIMVKTKQKLEGDVSVYFNKYFSPDFFSWIIPQSNEYGLMTTTRPAEYLSYFVKNLYLPPGRMYGYRIPYTYSKSYSNRAILVGDSCGQNKPLTGGGIIFSLTAARHATAAIRNSMKRNKFDARSLSSYERTWKRDIAWEIEKQFLLRKVYKTLTNKEVDELLKNFGPDLSGVNNFEYDKMSKMSKKVSKVKLANFFLTKITRTL